jgi:hypothetical protein
LKHGLPPERALLVKLSIASSKVLERETTVPGANGPHALTGSEKAKAFRTRANSFPAGLPALSLENNKARRHLSAGLII